MSNHYYLFMLRTACSECGEPLILDGPLLKARCLACQSLLDIAPANWKRVLEYRLDNHARQKMVSTVLGFAREWTFNLRIGPQSPKCAGCEKPLDVASMPAGMDGDLPCPCGHLTPTFPAPHWLREADPHAIQLFNAQREDTAAKSPVTARADRPVSFGCPDCGANLKIKVESPRILECQYCKTDLFLPDALWRALHPVRKRAAWYVQFT